MTRPPGARSSSPASRSATQARSVASKTASRRLEVVSSGPMSRKLVGLALMTSRRNPPRTRVASAVVAPGAGTWTA
jgi:hypothetical protein